jgi:hypothetical protein
MGAMTAFARTFLAFALCACAVGGGPSSPSAGSASSSFNLFTPEQDVEIGRQSAAEAEKQLPMLGDASADRRWDCPEAGGAGSRGQFCTAPKP